MNHWMEQDAQTLLQTQVRKDNDRMTMYNACQLSVVVPIYNEVESIPTLYKELKSALDALGQSYEVIVVDDGSKDDSFKMLSDIHQQDSRWQVIRFSRNYGQSAALAAGFANASGDVIITIDADLQNDPRDIPNLLHRLNSGYDIVSGWRKDRKENLVMRRLPSKIANGLISQVSGVHLHDYGCTLKAYRRDILRDVTLYGELHRFIPALAARDGATVCEIQVNDRARLYGSSKYGIGRVIRVIPDLVGVMFFLRYQDRAMIFFGGLSLVLGALGAVTLGLTLISMLVGQLIGWLVVLTAILFMTGLQTLLLGLVMESMARRAYDVQPAYRVREHLQQEPRL